MLPIVRVLATVSLAATRLRVRPAASTFWYSFDRLGGPDEVPPADLLPLPETTLVAAGEEHQQPLDEVGELVRRHVAPGELSIR